MKETPPPQPRDEIDGLLAKVAGGGLTGPERARLEALVRDDPAARQRYLDYLSVDAALRWRSGWAEVDAEATVPGDAEATPGAPGGTATAAQANVFQRAPWLAPALAASIALAAGLALNFSPFGDPPRYGGTDPITTTTPPTAPPPGTGRTPARASDAPFFQAAVEHRGWQLRAGPDARFELGEDGTVRLQQGALYAARGRSPEALTVSTPNGSVASASGRFLVEAQDSSPRESDVTSNDPETTMKTEDPPRPKPIRLTRLLVLAGTALLANAAGSAEAQTGEAVVAEGSAAPKKLEEEGNYREALEIYRKLVVDPAHGGADAAADLEGAWNCLARLGLFAEWDELVEAAVAAHPKDPRVLHAAARLYQHAPHSGVLIDNRFERAATSGGRRIDVSERDRVRALQLWQAALPGLGEVDDPAWKAAALAEFADAVLGGRQLWNLQYRTGLEELPALGVPTYWSSNGSPPVDPAGQPVFYRRPESWAAAQNDGERWRWLIHLRAGVSEAEADEAKLALAGFLHGQFGVHSSGTIANPVLEDGELAPEGRYTAHTLSDGETIARLANGVHRFDLPDGQNFIQLYRQVADRKPEEPPSPLRDLAFRIYAGTWDALPDFSQLEPASEGKLEDGLVDLGDAGRGDHFGAVFEGEIEVAAAGGYTFQIWSDDGSRLTVGDGTFTLDNDGLHGIEQNNKGTVELDAGRHPFRLEFFEKDGEEDIILTWEGPGTGGRQYLSRSRHEPNRQERALEQLANIFENRRQLERAAAVWRENIERFGPGKLAWKRQRLAQIVDNWVRLETAPIFPAGEKVKLPLSYRNAREVRFTARPVKIELFLEDIKAFLKSDPPRVQSQHRLSQLGHRIVVDNEEKYLTGESVDWTRQLDPPAGHWTRRTDAPTPLDEAGIYLVEATAGGGNTTRVLCWITDTVIVHKPVHERQLYFLADASTGAPVAGVNVEFFTYYARWERDAGRNFTATSNFAKRSDGDGLLSVGAAEIPERHSWLVIARGGGDGAGAGGGQRFGILGDFSRERMRVLTSSPYVDARAWCASDRPVYRPGQQVYLKAWVRLAQYDLDDVSAYAGREFVLKVKGPDRKEILSKKLRADEYGGLALDWRLEGDAMLGSYRFEVGAENYTRPSNGRHYDYRRLGSLSFRVEEYKKPEYEVTVDAPEEPAELGGAVAATVRANYFFGAPVTSASVKYTVRRRGHADTWFPARGWDWLYGPGYWWWGYDYEWYPGWRRWCLQRPGWFRSGPSEVVLENTVPIGADGTVKITIDTAAAKERWPDSDHRYTITAEVVDESRRTITGTGSVIAARDPFRVAVWLDGGHYRTGDQARARFRARTPDGKGVAGSGTARLLAVTFDDAGNPEEREVGRWEVTTDDDGAGELVFAAAAAGQYRLAVEVADARGRRAEGAALTRVTGPAGDVDPAGAGFRFDDLELVLDKAEYKPGERARLLVNTDRAGGTVLLFVRAANGVYPHPLVLRLDGKSTLHEFDIGVADQPNIHLEAFTVAGGRYFHRALPVAVPPEERVLNLAVEPSGERFQPGEKARVKLTLTDAEGKPFAGTAVVAVYDRSLEAIAQSGVPELRQYFWSWQRRHYSRGRVSLNHSFGQLLRPGETGMADLGAHRLGQLDRFARGRGLDSGVLRTRRGLNLEGIVVANKAVLEPGALALRQEDFGRDATVTAALGAINADSEGAAGGIGGPAAGAGPAVRSQFADTALWVSRVDTGDDGVAEVEVLMPENLTAWKVQAWAVGHGTRVGQGEAVILTSKDLLVRLQAPRFFTEKDEVVISANVHNYTGEAQDVRVALALEGDTLALALAVPGGADGDLTRVVRVEPDGDERVDWRVRAVREGEALVRVTAVAGGPGGKGDAMEQRFPVQVHGALRTESWSLALRGDEAVGRIEFEVPEERRVDQTLLEVRYSPSIALSVVDALPYLAGYPYKNSEAAMSRFGPLVKARKVLTGLGVDLAAVKEKRVNLNPQEIGDPQERARRWEMHKKTNPVFDNAAVDALVERGLRDLQGMQNNDGGWGWFPGDHSGAHTTAYVVSGLREAEADGLAVVPAVIEKGLKWLEGHQAEQVKRLQNAGRKIRPWKGTADNTDAFVLLVLAEAGKDVAAMADFIYRDRLGLTPYCQAMAGLAFHRLEDAGRRDQIIRNLGQFVVEDAENQTAFLRLPGRRWWWRWYGSDVEANAYYLKLLSRTDPRGARAAAVAKYLINNRRHGSYWNGTRDTAIAVAALAEYALASGETAPQLEVEVWVDGELRKSVVIDKDNLFTFDNALRLEGAAVTSGAHTVELRRKGAGPLYANAYLTTFTREDFIPKAGLEIKVERRYYKLVEADVDIAAAGSRGQVLGMRVDHHRRVPLASGDALTSGDLVEVELLLESKNDYEYLQFSDPKAAGFEAVAVRSGHQWAGGFGAYREARDDAVDFFVRRLPRGRHSLTYRVRAEVPGAFSALPANGNGVYAPELRANSDEFKVSVGERAL